MYLQQSEQRLGATGLGLCVVPKEVAVRKLIATDADLEAIGREMGKGRGLVIREVRTTLESVVRSALVLIERAESQLKRPRYTGQAGDDMRRRFRDAFGVDPEFVPPGENWEAGALVRERLRCAAKIMAEGHIEFVAWGPGSCPHRRDWSDRLWASVLAGRYRICLGQEFWKAAGIPDYMETATTLLHECLHIYFDTIRHRFERWAFNTASCYERYVLLCSGIPIPEDVNDPCPSKLPGAPIAKIGKRRKFGVAGVGIGALAQPTDEQRSVELLTKALQLNPREGYVKGSRGRLLLRVFTLSVPFSSAGKLHDQLKAGTDALGQLFRRRLHPATQKWVLDKLALRHRLHIQLSQ